MGEEHDRDRIAGLPRALDHGRRCRNDDVDIRADKFGRQRGHLLDTVGPAEHEYDVLAFGVAELAQAVPQRLHSAHPGGSRPEVKKADLCGFCGLLRARRERPRRRHAAERG
jgi:hypothetical protein